MELKERIVQEASRLFLHKGIRSVTMSDIAAHLGISKRTLYEVFQDKEELLEFCIDTHMKRADADMKELIRNSDNVIITMMHIYRLHLSELYNAGKSVIHDLKKYHPRLYAKIESTQRHGIEHLIPLYERGIDQGLIRTDINFEICMWLMKSQFKMLVEGEFIPVEKFSMNEFVRTIILNFVRGIATPKGYELIDKIILEVSTSNNN